MNGGFFFHIHGDLKVCTAVISMLLDRVAGYLAEFVVGECVFNVTYIGNACFSSPRYS